MINQILKTDFWPNLFPQAIRTMLEFAEEEVVLPKGPRRGTLFSGDYMPCLRFVFDAIEDKRWRKVAIVGPTQSGKSLVANNLPILYTLFELNEDLIVGIPDMEMARGVWNEKIMPVIESTRFRELLPTSGSGARGGAPVAIRFKNGASLRFMGAGGGDAQRSSHTARVIVMTEVDKMDDIGEASEEADPVSQIEMRADAFAETSKIILECTVTVEAGRIWQEAMVHGTGSTAWVPCPVCGRYQPLIREQMVFDPENAIVAEDSARYRCQHCGDMWDDGKRRQALFSPQLVHRGQEIDESGALIGEVPMTRTFGYHYNVLYSPMQSLGKTAAQQWEADASEYKEKKKAMTQSKWALPWKEQEENSAVVSYSMLRKLSTASSVDMRFVPDWQDWLIMEIDVQKRWLYWHAEAYRRDGTSQVVEYGVTDIADESDRAILKALDQTSDIAAEGWPLATDENTIVQPRLCLLDTGYRYDVIAGWLKNRTQWFGVKGVGRGSKVRASGAKAIFTIPGIVTVRPQDDGNKIWFIDVDQTKALVHDRYFLKPGQPGHTEIPRDVTQGYLMSLTAEQRKQSPNDDGFVWEKVRRRNDYLDCRSYGVAGAMYLSQRTIRDESTVQERVLANERKTGHAEDGRSAPRKSFLTTARQGPPTNWLNTSGRSLG